MPNQFQGAPFGVSGFQQLGLPNVETLLKLANQNTGQVVQAIISQFPAQSPTLSSLSISNSTAGGTTVKVGSGYLMSLSVTTPTTLATPNGKIYDASSPANVTSSNIMTLMPSSGNVNYGYPFVNGLTVQPSSTSSQVVSVYYI